MRILQRFSVPQLIKLAARSLLLAATFSLLPITSFAQEKISVKITIDRKLKALGSRGAIQSVRSALGSVGHTNFSFGNEITVETTESGLRKLMDLGMVESIEVTNVNLGTAKKATNRFRIVGWKLELNSRSKRVSGQTAFIQPGERTSWTARVLTSKVINARPQRKPIPKGRSLIVSSHDSAGRVLDRVRIPDPRLVHYDSIDSRGKIFTGGNLLKRNAIFNVQLKWNPNTTELRIVGSSPTSRLRQSIQVKNP